MFKKKKKLSTDLYLLRLISTEEISFNDMFFMLTGELPLSLYEAVTKLSILRDNRDINEESFEALIHAYECKDLLNILSRNISTELPVILKDNTIKQRSVSL